MMTTRGFPRKLSTRTEGIGCAAAIRLPSARRVASPLNLIVGKEIVLRGTHRFHEEFAWATKLICERRIDVRPIITATFPLGESATAFAIAGDRSQSCKVQLAFEEVA